MTSLQDIAGDRNLRDQRRALVIAHPNLRGLERIELVDQRSDRCIIDLRFLPSAVAGKSALPPNLKSDNVRIRSGKFGATLYTARALLSQDHLTIRAVFPPLAVLTGGADEGALILELHERAEIDPLSRVATLPLSATYAPSQPRSTPPPSIDDSDVDYLAKDYEGYYQLMLDRMAVLSPHWKERHAADIGVAIVEVLAYAADQLSYFQDAVATEAYLATARRRVSAKRHARLLDYRAHDGCASRAFVQIAVSQACAVARGLPILCSPASVAQHGVIRASGLSASSIADVPVFETLVDAALHPEHQRLPLYAWGAADYAVPAGATLAVLQGKFDALKRGDVLVLAAISDPATGSACADLSRRQAVRLNREPRFLDDPLTGSSLTEISWAVADALHFDLPVSAYIGGAPVQGLSEAWGNIVPVDAGRSFVETDPHPPTMNSAATVALSAGVAAMLSLDRGDLAFAVPYDDATAREIPASAFHTITPDQGVAQITLEEVGRSAHSGVWAPAQDLLGVGRFARRFVVESEDDGETKLRFGDDRNGRCPTPGVKLRARYRVGRMDVNVGAGTLMTWAPRDLGDEPVIGVFNPLPAQGGVQRESAADIRLRAPGAFHAQKRCVIAQDYADAALEHPAVFDAMARTEWAGSRSLIVVRIRPSAGGAASAELVREVSILLDQRKMIDADVDVRSAVFVPLNIAFALDVATPYTASEARRKVAARMRGLLDAKTMRFGQSVQLGPLIAAALHEPGVVDVRVKQFGRRGDRIDAGLGGDRIYMAPFEIGQIDDIVTPAGRGLLHVDARATP